MQRYCFEGAAVVNEFAMVLLSSSGFMCSVVWFSVNSCRLVISDHAVKQGQDIKDAGVLAGALRMAASTTSLARTTIPSILPQWEGNGKAARAHFERCGSLSANRTGIVDGKWVCTAHLNDRFRNKQTYQELIDLIRDYNASVVIQMRANAIEKGISMSKRWGEMKKLEDNSTKQPTEIEIANDVFDFSQQTLAFTRTIVHAAYHNFIPLPSPTQQRPLWIWYEDLARSCEMKFTELFHEIGMSHLPLPPSCKDFKFPEDKGPYNPVMIETLSEELLFRPMLNFSKFNLEVDTDSYRKQFEKETEMEGLLYGTW